MAEFDASDPLAWVDRFIHRLMARQDKYSNNYRYAIGDHPDPNGDPRYTRALKDMQRKAKTNYVGLAIKAVTDRMRVKGFRFGDPSELDDDAKRIWDYNNMYLQSLTAINGAATLSDTYALVSPPMEEGGEPVITIEDPRVCIVEPDPMNPMSSLAGMKFYEDSLREILVAVLWVPGLKYVFHGPSLHDFLRRDTIGPAVDLLNSVGGFVLQSVEPSLDVVPLIRGPWQPHRGVVGMAECEDGGYEVQDRINDTVLARMIIARNQAYRQRWATGINIPQSKKGVRASPFDPGSDMVWAVADSEAKFGDFEQADIRQLLEAIRDDVGDFAALTGTPVVYLTNKMVNVSADTLVAAQVALGAKTRTRMEAMGWFFEQVMKTAFLYKGDARAKEIAAETVWEDPESRSMAEIADFVSKLSTAGVPLSVSLPRVGFSEQETQASVEEVEKLREEAKQAADKALEQKAATSTSASSSPSSKTKPSSSR